MAFWAEQGKVSNPVGIQWTLPQSSPLIKSNINMIESTGKMKGKKQFG